MGLSGCPDGGDVCRAFRDVGPTRELRLSQVLTEFAGPLRLQPLPQGFAPRKTFLFLVSIARLTLRTVRTFILAVGRWPTATAGRFAVRQPNLCCGFRRSWRFRLAARLSFLLRRCGPCPVRCPFR